MEVAVEKIYQTIDINGGQELTKYDIFSKQNNILITYRKVGSSDMFFGVRSLNYKQLSANQEIIPKYDEITDFNNGLAIAHSIPRHYLINEEGQEILSKEYLKYCANNTYCFIEDDSIGLLDKKGQEIFKMKGDILTYLGQDLYSFKQDKLYGVVNIKGEILFDAIYKSVLLINKQRFAVLTANKRWQIIDDKNKIIKSFSKRVMSVNIKQNYVLTQESSFWISLENDQSLRDTNGEKIINSKFSDYIIFDDDIIAGKEIVYHIDNSMDIKYSVINAALKKVYPYKFANKPNFKSSVARVKPYKMKNDGILDKQGNLTTVDYAIESDFINGVAIARLGYYNCILINELGQELSMKTYDDIWRFDEELFKAILGEKVGLINLKGEEVVKPIYDSIEKFHDGVAIVELNNRYGVIDREGKEIVKLQSRKIKEVKVFNNYLLYKDDNQYTLVDREGKCYFRDIIADKVIFINNEQIIIDNRLFNINNLKYLYQLDFQVGAFSFTKSFDNNNDRDKYIKVLSSSASTKIINEYQKMNKELKQLKNAYSQKIDEIMDIAIEESKTSNIKVKVRK